MNRAGGRFAAVVAGALPAARSSVTYRHWLRGDDKDALVHRAGVILAGIVDWFNHPGDTA